MTKAGFVLLLATAIAVAAQSPRTSDEFQQQVLPVLNRTCSGCHNDQAQAGGFSFGAIRDAAAAEKRPELWLKVLEKLNTGQMPPRPAAPLSAIETATVTGWIRKLPAVVASIGNDTAQNPGRVTARRLNRVEYNNTVRDLLGVSLRPADEFPVDDSGYGFDNIGDVLTVSPLLMEKYFQTARTISRAAIYGE